MQCLSSAGQPKTGCNNPDVISQVPTGEIMFLDWLAVLLLQPRSRLVVALAAKVRFWLMVSLSTRTPKAFSANLLSG